RSDRFLPNGWSSEGRSAKTFFFSNGRDCMEICPKRLDRWLRIMIFDLAIIGGGPAGCAAAIVSASGGARVLLLERTRFPRHKVCGEFVSAESLGLLQDPLAKEFRYLLSC